MRKHYLLSTMLFAAISSFAQAQNVGIGPSSFTPDAHSMLHVWGNSAGVGILIPNMTAATRTGMSPDATDYGLLVYQTDGGTDAGYWYWDGAAWTRLFNGTGTGWALTGNALTGATSDAPNEWIGSTNTYDWVIKTDNTERMRVNSAGWIGINATPVANTQLRVDKTAAASGYAIYGSASGGGLGTTNYGGYFTATGASSNNVGGYFYIPAGTTSIESYGVSANNFSTQGGVLSWQQGIFTQKTGNMVTGNGVGIQARAEGTATTNYAGYFRATGATTNYGSYHLITNATTAVTNYAVYGVNQAISAGAANQYGVYGLKSGNIGTVGSPTGYGVFGRASGTASSNIGGYFQAYDATSNYGVWGSTTGATTTTGNSSYALRGDNQCTSAADNINMYGLYASKTGNMATGTNRKGYGVYAAASGTADVNYGGYFSGAGGTANYGAYATTASNDGIGLYASNTSGGGGTLYGVKSEITATSTGTTYGMYARTAGSAIMSGTHYGIYAETAGSSGVGTSYAVYGNGGYYGGYFEGSRGVYGEGVDYGVKGYSTLSIGVVGENASTANMNATGVSGYASGVNADPNYWRCGVSGSSSTASGVNYGVKGSASNAVTNYGVYGYGGGGTNNYGIYGIGTYGVYGFGSSPTGTTTSYGVYAYSDEDGAAGQPVYALKSELSTMGWDGTDAATGYAIYATAGGRRGTNYVGYFTTTGTATFSGAATTNYGINVVVDAWNATTNYGVKTDVTSVTPGTNYAGYFSASNATTANYSLVADAGKFRLGSSGTATSQFIHGTVSVNPPSIAAHSQGSFAVVIAGLAAGDLIFFTPPSTLENGLVFQGATTAAGSVTIMMGNYNTAAVDGAARTWSYLIIRP